MSEEELRQYCKDASNENIKLGEENTKLKSVLKKIREYIKYNATSNYFDSETNMFRREIDLLEIIDKGIGEDKK